MLQNAQLIAFVPTRDPGKSRHFYEEVLGLKFLHEDPVAMVFNANGVMIRIANVAGVPDCKPAPFTILGWRVQHAETSVRELAKKGIKCERFAGMQQDELAIWRSPAGARVAWFKDPDGNVLSLTEFEEEKH